MPFAQTASDRARHAIAGARHEPFWLSHPDRPAARAPLDGVTTADLVVVGAGLSGLWTAVRAKQRRPELDVVLLEGGRIAQSASGRNGGFVSASITHGHLNGIERWPSEFATLQAMGVENLRGIEKTIAEHGIDCGYHRTGEIDVTTEPYQLQHAHDHVAQAHAHGVEVEFWNAERVQSEVASPLYQGAIFDPEVGIVDPARLCWGLARVAEELGVRIFEHSPAQSLHPSGAGMAVSTYSGRIETLRVALTTAAHAPLLKRLNAYVVPVFDHVVVTAPLPADVRAAIGWQNRQGIGDAGNQFHYYRRTLDDRILFGGFDANYHFRGRIDPALEQSVSHDLLATHFFAIFPQLAGLRFTHRWAGVIDTTSRFTPFFGRTHGGRVAYAVGYTGLGVGSSRFGARVALDLLSGRDTELTGLGMVRRKPVPFPPEPIRYAAVRATRSSLAAEDRTGRRNVWLRTLDRLGVGFDS